MNFGHNQNINYNGEMYHVQTEDGGKNNPVITTLVFKDGIVLGSRRTSYADILKSNELDKVVREVMREQHASVIKDLMAGLFDKKG
jgi:hypothetical protein